MSASGQRHVDAAKEDGRWEAAYSGSANMTIPPGFFVALEKNAEARAFFASLDRATLFAFHYRLTMAIRPETRAKRMQNIIDRLARSERFH